MNTALQGLKLNIFHRKKEIYFVAVWVNLSPHYFVFYSNLQEALESMRHIAMLINERKRKLESVEKLSQWQQRVIDWEVRSDWQLLQLIEILYLKVKFTPILKQTEILMMVICYSVFSFCFIFWECSYNGLQKKSSF